MRKIFSTIAFVIVVIAFLVLFGGVALLDISIRLMWICFSLLMAFAYNSLGFDIVAHMVNNLLAKHDFYPGHKLMVDEVRTVRGDKIVLCGLEAKRPDGSTVARAELIEVRGSIFRLLLAGVLENKTGRFSCWLRRSIFGTGSCITLEQIKELVLKQPQLQLSLEQHREDLLLYSAQAATKIGLANDSLRGDSTAEQANGAAGTRDGSAAAHGGTAGTKGVAAACTGRADQSWDYFPRIYIEDGSACLQLPEHQLQIDNINGVANRLQHQDYHFYGRLEGENISIIANGEQDIEFKIGRLNLDKLYRLLQGQLDLGLNRCEGAVRELGGIVACMDGTWQLKRLEGRLENGFIEARGIRLDDIEGYCASEDFTEFTPRSLQIKRLTCRVNNKQLRIAGSLQLQEALAYDLELDSERIYLEGGPEFLIYSGLKLVGSVQPYGEGYLVPVSLQGRVRVDLPEQPPVRLENFAGQVYVSSSCLQCQEAQLQVNGAPLVLSQAQWLFATGEYRGQLQGMAIETKINTPQRAKAQLSFTAEIRGNLKEKQLQVKSGYQLNGIQCSFIKLKSITGQLQITNEDVQFIDSQAELLEGVKISLPVYWQEGRLHFDLQGLRLDTEALKDTLKSAVQNKAEEAVEQAKNKADAAKTAVQEKVDQAVEVVQSSLEEAKTAAQSKLSSIKSKTSSLWQKGKGLLGRSVSGEVQASQETQSSKEAAGIKQLQSPVQGLLEEKKE